MLRKTMLALLLLAGTSGYCSAINPHKGYPSTPRDYGIRHDSLTVTTADGFRLAAWFYPAQDTAGIAHNIVGRRARVPDSLKKTPLPQPPWDGTPRPVVVISTGDAGNMMGNIIYAYSLCTRGLNVLTFDWRGFGDSDPWPPGKSMERDRLSYTEFLLDYAAVLDMLQQRPDIDPERIGLFGYSTGAYLAFAMAASRNDVAAFAGRGLLTSFDDLLPLLREALPDRDFAAPPDYPDSLLPIHAAHRVRIPTLLIVGDKDVRTPPWMTEQVASKLGRPGEVWIVPGAEHGGNSGPEFVNFPEFFVRLAKFFTTHLGNR